MAFKNTFIVFVICIVVVNTFAASVQKRHKSILEASRIKREDQVEICGGGAPCGWAVYRPFSRVVEYFMKNQCECPKETKCQRHFDDLSISAYVYRCKAPEKE